MRSPVLTVLCLLSTACGNDGSDPPRTPDPSEVGGAQTGGETDGDAPGDGERCVDSDGDGYGRHCASGADCNDADDTLFEECPSCYAEEKGCACEPDALPLDCNLSHDEIAAVSGLCKTGTRYCRDGVWTGCIGVASVAH